MKNKFNSAPIIRRGKRGLYVDMDELNQLFFADEWSEEEKQIIESQLDVVQYIRGLLKPQMWEGLNAKITPRINLADGFSLTIELYAFTIAENNPCMRYVLRVVNDEWEMTTTAVHRQVNPLSLISTDLETLRFPAADIKRVLGHIKTEQRKYQRSFK